MLMEGNDAKVGMPTGQPQEDGVAPSIVPLRVFTAEPLSVPICTTSLRGTSLQGLHFFTRAVAVGKLMWNCTITRELRPWIFRLEHSGLYENHNPKVYRIEQASIFALPQADESVDGVYNLGVLEHFTGEDIRSILREFHRVLRVGGKVLVFWPHERGTSVFVLSGYISCSIEC